MRSASRFKLINNFHKCNINESKLAKVIELRQLYEYTRYLTQVLLLLEFLVNEAVCMWKGDRHIVYYINMFTIFFVFLI